MLALGYYPPQSSRRSSIISSSRLSKKEGEEEEERRHSQRNRFQVELEKYSSGSGTTGIIPMHGCY